MNERLKSWRDSLLEKIPHKNRTPQQKAALTKTLSIIGILLCVLALLMLTLALFPITSVRVESNQSGYTQEQIIEGLGMKGWTPILSLTPHRAEQNLMTNLLYLESAEVTYGFPATLHISVTEQKPLYYFYYDTEISGKSHTGWMAIGPDLRVVDAAREGEGFAQRGLTKIALPPPVLDQTTPGRDSKLCFTREEEVEEGGKTEEDFTYISEFLGYLENSSVASRLTSVDLSEKFDVRITLESKIRIDFGRVRNETDFLQKLSTAEQILAQATMDPEQKYIILVGSDECSMYPAKDMDLDALE